MWIIVQVLALSSAIYIVLQTWFEFTSNPTFTTLLSKQYQTFQVPFPGIAICNINKISRQSVERYVKRLAPLIPTVTEELLMERIKYLGRIYDNDIEGLEDMTWLQDILDRIDSNETTGFYDVRERMRQISPRCEDMLVKCSWLGTPTNCSSIFVRKRSKDGFCCLFNYVRENDKNT